MITVKISKSIPLTKTMEACFAVRSGEGTLLSILNKTLKAMPSDMLQVHLLFMTVQQIR